MFSPGYVPEADAMPDFDRRTSRRDSRAGRANSNRITSLTPPTSTDTPGTARRTMRRRSQASVRCLIRASGGHPFENPCQNPLTHFGRKPFELRGRSGLVFGRTGHFREPDFLGALAHPCRFIARASSHNWAALAATRRARWRASPRDAQGNPSGNHSKSRVFELVARERGNCSSPYGGAVRQEGKGHGLREQLSTHRKQDRADHDGGDR
jgi:hypothetical protein